MPQARHTFHFDSDGDRVSRGMREREGKERHRCRGGGKMEQKWGEKSQGRSFLPIPVALTSQTWCLSLGWLNAIQ